MTWAQAKVGVEGEGYKARQGWGRGSGVMGRSDACLSEMDTLYRIPIRLAGEACGPIQAACNIPFERYRRYL